MRTCPSSYSSAFNSRPEYEISRNPLSLSAQQLIALIMQILLEAEASIRSSGQECR